MSSLEHDALEHVLAEQVGCAEAMLDLLAREHMALLEGDTEHLNRLGLEKARLLEDLEALEHARSDLMDLRDAEVAPPSAVWTRLLGLMERCRDQNLRNGALLTARREQVAGVLSALRGGEALLYDEHGTTGRGAIARSLGEA